MLDLVLAYYSTVILHVLLKGFLINVCAHRARVSSVVWNPTWRWSATNLKELWFCHSCSAQVGWNHSVPSQPVPLLFNGMIKLRRWPPVTAYVTVKLSFVHIDAFLLLRYGVSVGPDAGGLPLQSTFPWALQHVQAVHAWQAHTPESTTLLQGGITDFAVLKCKVFVWV